MEKLIFTNYEERELEKLIIDCVNTCLRTIPVQLEAPTQPDSDPDELLKKREAAKLLSCSTSTIDNYARAGILPRHYVGRSVRFRRSDVLAIPSPSKNKG